MCGFNRRILKLTTLLLFFSPVALSTECADNWWCESRVTAESLANTLTQLTNWESKEKKRKYFSKRSLQPIPMTESILQQYVLSPSHPEKTLYGYSELHFTVRKAAKFVELLLGVNEITILRVNSSHPIIGDDITDAHTSGIAIDLGYILNPKTKQLDLEAQFWFTYMLMKTAKHYGGSLWTGSAYKQELVSYADHLRRQKILRDSYLIYSIANDFERYHVSHLHFSIRKDK